MADQYSDENLSSGPSSGTDPSLEPGQYPSSLFGWPLPQGSGAGGSQGAQPAAGGQQIDFTRPDGVWQAREVAPQRIGGAGDGTTVMSQGYEGISGLGPADICDSGAGKGSVSTPHHPTSGAGLDGVRP